MLGNYTKGDIASLTLAFCLIAGLSAYIVMQDEPSCPDADTGPTFDFVMGLCD